MIVTEKQTNADKYHKLFVDAYQFLKSIDPDNYPGDRFNNLAEYYGHMADFIALGDSGYKYIMLPLDEEAFNIDLDSRTINVPASFNKCASVLSDQLAETIIFIADRYFDYMDLATTQIFVLWETPEDKKNNIAAVKGATRVEMMDVESEPGKIKFAWPLNDTITKVPGTIKFSVRFCRLNGEDFNDLFYSLNTLEASFTIKPALAADMPRDDNKIISPFGRDLFVNAIINSHYSTDGVTPPTMAEFSSPGEDIFSNNGITIVDGKKITHLNDDDTVTLYAQAYTSDPNSVVEYKWYYSETIGDDAVYYNCLNYPTAESFDEDGNLLSIGEDDDGNEIPVIATNKEDPIYGAITMGEVKQEDYLLCDPQPTKRVAREVYYYIINSDEENQVGYIPEYAEYMLDTFNEDIPVYEKYTSFTIPATLPDADPAIITGSYKVAAWGIKKISNKDDLKTPYSRSSSSCIIPIPNEIEFKTDLNANEILEKENDATVELKVEVAADPYNPDLTYSWKGGHTDPNSLTDLGADEAIYEVNDIGWYEATVESTLNRTPVSATSAVCKVTNPVTPPIVTSLKTDEIYVSSRASELTNNPADGYEGVNVQLAVLRVNADVVNATGYHKALYTDNIENGVIKSFKYIWLICPLNGTYNDITNATPGVILDDKNPNQITVTPRLKEQVSNFRCLVVNTLNEESAVFDHSGVGLKDSEIAALGDFKKEAPYIYNTPETLSFVFTVIRS